MAGKNGDSTKVRSEGESRVQCNTKEIPRNLTEEE